MRVGKRFVGMSSEWAFQELRQSVKAAEDLIRAKVEHSFRLGPKFSRKLASIGVLFGCFVSKIDDDSWFTWWFNHLRGISIYFP